MYSIAIFQISAYQSALARTEPHVLTVSSPTPVNALQDILESTVKLVAFAHHHQGGLVHHLLSIRILNSAIVYICMGVPRMRNLYTER